LALVELSVVEQRYRAVLAAAAGVPVIEVAERYGVSRQSVHAWVRRYEQGGLGGLMDQSRRPESCPHQVSSEVEAAVCELRREHPRWGPLRLAHDLQGDPHRVRPRSGTPAVSTAWRDRLAPEPVGAENLCHQAILVNQSSGAVAA
jgi:transposase-like protein